MDELAELKALVRSVALGLYRSKFWQQLPWGPKQVLSGFIREEIEKDRPAEAGPVAEPPRVKRKLEAPWE